MGKAEKGTPLATPLEVAEALHQRAAAWGAVPDLHIDEAGEFVESCLGLLLPHLARQRSKSVRETEARLVALGGQLRYALCEVMPDDRARAEDIAARFIAALPEVADLLRLDAQAALAGDPAADSIDEVVLAYPGVYAVAVYRLAHLLAREGVLLLPRLMSEYAHRVTGIDINPRAVIGRSFFIDHGTSVVIGETCVIGNNVKIYQGVTLGALSVERSAKHTKRHPTIEDDVVIYANATILGGDTVIGRGSIIGGNVWVTRSVPPGSRVMYRSLGGQGVSEPAPQRPDDFVI